MDRDRKIRVVFVCTGNICRSPMAEAVFQHLVNEGGLAEQFQIESAGTASYHVGERPHIGTQRILKQKHVPLDEGKNAIHIDRSNLQDYDYVIALDSGHVSELLQYTPVQRLLDFAPQTGLVDVPDPYYENNFEQVFELVMDGCKGLLDHIRATEGL